MRKERAGTSRAARAAVGCIVLLTGCMMPPPQKRSTPAEEYVRKVRGVGFKSEEGAALVPVAGAAGAAASGRGDDAPRFRYAGGTMPTTDRERAQYETNIGNGGGNDRQGFTEYRSSNPPVNDYNGPLSLGDPGVTASLWREGRGYNNVIYRDYRAFQPMDLITIVVAENSIGQKSADTEVKQTSAVAAAIQNFLGLESKATKQDPGIDPEAVITASTRNDFKGEGSTNRVDTLTARISAMVVEVLPSGVIRIEGERIVALNNEEQVMVISGLVRPQDINSLNEIQSTKIANMRIDYYGNGTVGEAQYGGWASRLMRYVWPF